MSMGVSWSHENYQSDGSSSLKQPAEKLGDTSIHGNKSSEPAQEQCNAAPKLEMSPSEARDFFTDSDVSGQLNLPSLRSDSLLSDTGGFDRGDFSHKQIANVEATHTKTVPVEARHMRPGAEVSKKWNCTTLRPHNLKIDREIMNSESHKLKLEVVAQSKLGNAESTLTEHDERKVGIDAQCELEESVILTDKLTTFSEDASRKFTESMHHEGNKCELEIHAQTQLEESGSEVHVVLLDHQTACSENVSINFTGNMHAEEHKHELEISHSVLEVFGKKGSPILASEPLTFFEDETISFSGKHIGTSSDDLKVFSSTENTGLQHERLACELNHGNLTPKPLNESEYPKSESSISTVVDAKENASNACLGDGELSLPFVDCDSLDLLPETDSMDANLVHLMLPHCDGKNADLPAPPEKAVVESYDQPEIGEEGTPILSKKRRKSTAETSAVSTRVLRSGSKDKSEAPLPNNVAAEVTDAIDKKGNRKRKQMKKTPVSEFSRMRNHLRYLLQRIKNEQNLIDAYSFEGWRKQSLEKIKPEKELQQAKTHILRYKLKIRYLFQCLDVSLTEGQIPESLFDSEGEIESEDIFCAKCASKDVSLDNDIILCDGACERGFHQFCLEPPLLKEDIPQGDEGWFCPGCDCKIDCIDLLNDLNRVKLSVLDSWEKVFPEADATGPGKTLEDGSGLPSDDSDDDDYDPDKIEVDEVLPDQVTTKDHYMGLPSDDSEDDDFDPDAPDDDEDDQAKENSSSDFTSDSEDMGAVLQDNTSTCNDQAESSRDGELEMGVSVDRPSLKDEISYPLNSNESLLASKRHVKRLDYKMLHDQIYGNESSESSDEDFDVGCKRRKNVLGRIPGKGSASAGNESDIRPMGGDQEERKSLKQASKQFDPEHGNKFSKSHATSSEARSRKRLGEAAIQRLSESFKQNQYPERPEKENLARDLELTIKQVAKWFEHARWSSRHSATKILNWTSDPSRGQASSLQANDELEDRNQMVDGELAPGNENNIAALPGPNLGAKPTRTVDVVDPPIADEDFEENVGLKRRKNVSGRILGKGSTSAGNESDIRPMGGDQEERRSVKQTRKQFDTKHGYKFSKSHATSSEARSSKRLGETATQRLSESFKQNQYPERPEKENLARDLELTIKQVAKWFEHARSSSRHSAAKILNWTSDSDPSRGQASSLQAKDELKDMSQMVDRELAPGNKNNIAASPGADLGVKPTRTVDGVMEPPIAEIPGTPKSRRRKNEKDDESPSGRQKNMKGISQVDSPDPGVRRSSRLQ